MIAVCSPLFFFQAEDGIRYDLVTGVQTCALPISRCAIRPARVRRVFRRHAEIKRAMGVRRFIFRGVTKVRDEWRSEERRVGKEGGSRGSSVRLDRMWM